MAGFIRWMAGAGLAALAALFLALGLDHRAAVTLPVPTGPYAVGRTTAFWEDGQHSDPLAPVSGTPRRLVAWIWYPAAPPPSPPAYEDYLPPAWRTALERHSGVLLTKFLTRDLSRVHTHSVRGAAVSALKSTWPVVLLRAGLSALTTDYTTLAEDLASHGYVVVGFDAPYRTVVVVLPDGTVIERAPANDADLVEGPAKEQLAIRLMQAWSADTGFALDRLARLNAVDPSGRFRGRLDLERVGVAGHSLGGATTLQFCHDDLRCRAGIDLDGAPWGPVVAQGVTQPFLFLLGDHSREPAEETARIQANIRSVYERLPEGRRFELVIRGANHFFFSDNGALLKSHVILGMLHTLGIVGIDGGRQLAATSYAVHTFFDAYLKQAAGSRAAIQSPDYPEIQPVR